MREFNYFDLSNQTWDTETLSLLTGIYQEIGKQRFFINAHQVKLSTLTVTALKDSTIASNAIEGIVTTKPRLTQLMEKQAGPKTRSEKEIVGYRDVLSMILDSYEAIQITKNHILQLHKILYGRLNDPMGGRTKDVQNYIVATRSDGYREVIFTPLSPLETPEALDRVCKEYVLAIGKRVVDPLILIPIFIHDFLCIHPFNDGNGRMSRLLTTLLLCQNGFLVGKYISLEEKIARDKEPYYEALQQCSEGWHEGRAIPLPFIKYLLGTILSAYKDLDERVSLMDGTLSALETVRMAVRTRIGRIAKADVLEICPWLSLSSVEGSLRKLVDLGELRREGTGKATYYVRLD